MRERVPCTRAHLALRWFAGCKCIEYNMCGSMCANCDVMCVCKCVCVGFRRPILTEKLFIIHKFVNGFLTFLLCNISAVYPFAIYVQSNLPKVFVPDPLLAASAVAILLPWCSLFVCSFIWFEKYNLIIMISATSHCVAQNRVLFRLIQHNHNDKMRMFTNFSMRMNKQKKQNDLRNERMNERTNGRRSTVEKVEK